MIMMIPNEFSHGKWPIEIEVYLLNMGGSFHGYVSHNQIVDPPGVFSQMFPFDLP